MAEAASIGPHLTFSQFPSLEPPKSTPFKCYIQKGADKNAPFEAQPTIVAGEAETVEFFTADGPLSSTGCSYMIHVHDKRTNTMTLRPVPLHILTRQVKALKNLRPIEVSTEERMAQRNNLGEAFGTKKAKAAIQEAKATADSSRLIPPCNADAQLRELRYCNVYHRTHPFFCWIMSGPSKDTLEVLELRSPNIRPDTLAELSVGARLRSLLLPVVSLQQGGELASIAPKLEELELLMVTPFPSSVFDGLPPGLVHLGLRDASGDAGLAAHVHALAAYHDRSGGTLRVLSHHRRCEDADEEEGGESRDALALFQFCQFRSFGPMYGHYAGERVPLGPARTFPWPAPLSERRAVTVDEYGFRMGGKAKRSFVRRVAKAAGKAFGSSIPPVALAKP
ncbi:A49-like RNA polymerase I associated factor-domain-containing protein [Trametes polyzona]|nr:A49-like RNA polymerase I associated factor-domain-containing protein [Trametes polyzona]